MEVDRWAMWDFVHKFQPVDQASQISDSTAIHSNICCSSSMEYGLGSTDSTFRSEHLRTDAALEPPNPLVFMGWEPLLEPSKNMTPAKKKWDINGFEAHPLVMSK